MIEFVLYYNKVYKHTLITITKTIKGHYIYISQDNIYIDNIKVATYEEINRIEFIIKGYRQRIDCNSKGKIYSTDIEVPAYEGV